MAKGWRGAAVLVFMSAGMLAATPLASADTGSTAHNNGSPSNPGAAGQNTPVLLPNQVAGAAPAYPLPNASGSSHTARQAPVNMSPVRQAPPNSGPVNSSAGSSNPVYSNPTYSSPAYPSSSYPGTPYAGSSYPGSSTSGAAYPGPNYAGPSHSTPVNQAPVNQAPVNQGTRSQGAGNQGLHNQGLHNQAPRNQGPGNQTPVNPAPPASTAATQLTITIAASTVAGHNGQFTLTCRPVGGTHPDPTNACGKLDQFAAAGTDPFAPVPANQMCSMVSGGPATARIVGSWQGRRIDTTFSRTNSCQTSRWNNLLPILSPESASTS